MLRAYCDELRDQPVQTLPAHVGQLPVAAAVAKLQQVLRAFPRAVIAQLFKICFQLFRSDSVPPQLHIVGL